MKDQADKEKLSDLKCRRNVKKKFITKFQKQMIKKVKLKQYFIVLKFEVGFYLKEKPICFRLLFLFLFLCEFILQTAEHGSKSTSETNCLYFFNCTYSMLALHAALKYIANSSKTI